MTIVIYENGNAIISTPAVGGGFENTQTSGTAEELRKRFAHFPNLQVVEKSAVDWQSDAVKIRGIEWPHWW